MKHLKKYNENINTELLEIKEYVTNCFIDFVDEGATVHLYTYAGEYRIEVKIPRTQDTRTVISMSNIIQNTIDKNEAENEILRNILTSIEKVKIRHKLYYTFETYNSEYELSFNL